MTPDVLSIFNSAMGMACGAAVTGVAAYLFSRFKKSAGIPNRMSRIEDAVMMILRGMGEQNIALKASLEAHKGKCNGNVDDALEVIQKSDTDRRIFFEKQALQGGTRERSK